MMAREQRGVVYVEFLISFMCFFTLFVSAVQLSVMATARLVVQHAAVQAARAAVVTIDDDPVFYEDGDRKHLQGKGSGKQRSKTTEQALALIMAGTGHSLTGLGSRGTDRLNRVRNAAYLPLSVISPTAEQVARLVPSATSINPSLAESSIHADLGDNPAMRVVTGFGVYGRVAAAITFPVKPGSEELHSSSDAVFADRELVTVRVTYLLPCNVPLGRDIACDNLADATGLPALQRRSEEALKQPSFGSVKNLYDSVQNVSKSFDKLTRQLTELTRAEWSSLQLAMYLQPSERFVILTGEASLPNHGAPYKYYSELKEGGSP